MDTMERPVINVADKAPRQHHSLEFKLRIIEAILKPGASVARIARANGVNANQVFGWRKLYLEGRLGSKATNAPCLLPVTVIGDTPAVTPVGVLDASDDRPLHARLRVESSKGNLIVEGRPDLMTLRLVLERLLG
jgi:transposase